MGNGAVHGNSAARTTIHRRSIWDSFEPGEHLPAGETLVFEGLLLRLILWEQPDALTSWSQCKAWISSGGGFFAWDADSETPMGRSVAGLVASCFDRAPAGYFGFQLNPSSGCLGPDNGEIAGALTIAAKSLEDRDIWIGHLKAASTTGGNLTPSTRRRMSTCRLGDKIIRQASIEGEEEPMCETLSECVRKCRHDTEGFERCKELHERPERRLLGSQLLWSDASQTLMFFDWDDTLFPTTWIREDLGLDWRRSLKEQAEPSPDRDEAERLLERLGQRVEKMIAIACRLAKVCIVTLAKTPWVDTSSLCFMPILIEVLQRHSVPVIYARELITEEARAAYTRADAVTPEFEDLFWKQAKESAMLRELETFYGSDRSWKNVISIGDSETERSALRSVCSNYIDSVSPHCNVLQRGLTPEVVTTDGEFKRLRVKTLKMLEQPSCEELLAQVYALTKWLPFLVCSEVGMDIEISTSENDEELTALHKQLTNTDEVLSWWNLVDNE